MFYTIACLQRNADKASKLDESLRSGTLAGVQAVSRFRAKFNAVPEAANSPGKPKPISRVSEEAETRQKSVSPVDSLYSTSSASSEEPPNNGMRAQRRCTGEEMDPPSVVYRVSTVGRG